MRPERTWKCLPELPDLLGLSCHACNRYGVPEPYEKLKAFTRGQTVTQQSMQEFVHGLADLPDEARQALAHLTPEAYVGNAEQQANSLAEALASLAKH